MSDDQERRQIKENSNGRHMPLPHLREEIRLHAGPAETDGYPTWTLHDPVTNQFFRLGWKGFEILRRIGELQTVGEVLDDINSQTTLSIEEEDVLNIIRFLYENELAQSTHPYQAQRLNDKVDKRRAVWWKQAMHSYLFLRIPLVRPDGFLEKTKHLVRPLFSRSFFVFMIVLGVLGGVLTLFRFDEFANTFMHFFSWQGVFIYVLALVFVKICHELAHAYSAKLSGVEVSVMGVALIVLYPVLYTDTSGAWKLVDKRRRLQIGYAGVMAEFYLAVCALLMWHILPEGAMKSAAFFVATVSFAMSILVNFNPLMRFDGYYLLSDVLGVDNMQTRAFALTKWHLRRFLLGVRVPKPEIFRASLERILITYGYATWVYRFFLFAGIAVLIFYLFPQPLGAVLMAVELGFFIALPVWRELKAWWDGRDHISARGRRLCGAIVLAVMVGLVVPWRGSVEIPAVMQAERYQKVTPPVAARVVDIKVRHGEHIKKGDPLVVLSSDALDSKIERVQQRLDMLAQQINVTQRDKSLIKERQALLSRRSEAQSRLDSLLSMRAQLTLRSDIDGQVFYTQDALHKGLWVAAGETLLNIVNMREQVLYAYINERDYTRIHRGANGRFYPDNAVHVPVSVVVGDIDTVSSRQLTYPELASRYGGPIAVENGQGEERLIAHNAIYRVRLTSQNKEEVQSVPSLRLRGAVVVEGHAESMLYNMFRHVRSIIMREFGI